MRPPEKGSPASTRTQPRSPASGMPTKYRLTMATCSPATSGATFNRPWSVWDVGASAAVAMTTPRAGAGDGQSREGACTPRADRSVPEVADAGEHHRQAVLVAGADRVLVPHRAARLDDRRDAGRRGGVHVVTEREEGV